MTNISHQSPLPETADDDRDAQTRRELLEEITRARQAAAHGVALGRSLIESNQRMMDLAGTLKPIVESAPPHLLRDPLSSQVLSGLREYRSTAETVAYELSPLAQTLHTAVSSTMSAASIAVTSTDWSSSHGLSKIEPLVNLQRQWIEPPTIQDMLRTLRLDVPRGQNRSAVDLLEDSERALAITGSDADYGAGVTIPLREAINAAVDELLKRRPATSKTGGGLSDKILAVSAQCGRATNTPETVARVAASAARLLDELSGTKNKNAGRERVRALFVQGLAVLEDIADLIDVAKLRQI